jgi:serine protein kinase
VNLQSILEQIKAQKEQLGWEGTFRDYFAMAIREPRLARLSHALIYDSLLSYGVEKPASVAPVYRLFSSELFGIENSVQQIVEYFRASASGFDTRKRILLLVGPPASGKSSLVNLIKSGLEQYTRRESGAVYAIQGCPVQEEPLHLIPPEFRDQIASRYGLHIEGDLCPHCRWMLDEKYGGEIERVPIQRISLSEQLGIGIGTLVATDPGSQDIARLIGSVDESLLQGDRLQSFGKAYRLNGELDVANRGLVEFIEIFKLDERYLSLLLVLSEEQKVKAPGFGTLYLDEAILAHTNEADYEAVLSNPHTEGLQDRMVVVRVPYNLRASQEVRIYQKLLRQVDLKNVQLSPLCLPVAANFAILSRLEPPNRAGLSLIDKLRLYDGQYSARFRPQDVEEMQSEASREGMFGISPRFVINQIARAAGGKRPCLDPLDLLQTLWAGLEQNARLAHTEHQRLYSLFQEARRSYDRLAQQAVQQACSPNFRQEAIRLTTEYLQCVERWMQLNSPVGSEANGRRLGGQSTDPANEAQLKDMEASVHVQDYDAPAFRRQVFAQAQISGFSGVSTAGSSAENQEGIPNDLDLIPAALREALIQRLCPNERRVEELAAAKEATSDGLFRKRQEVKERLIAEYGYRAECAERLLRYVAELRPHGLFSRPRLSKALGWMRD